MSVVSWLSGGIIGWLFFLIAQFLSAVFGIFVSILAWAVAVMLSMSTNIVNSGPVQAGFPITLAIANLGFVLAIIIMAVATILRYETYGVKKFLSKVVIMAVLVNFGLIISGALLNVSDSLTTYYLNSLTGNSITGFASKMAGAFNPQRLFSTSQSTLNDTKTAEQLNNVGSGIASIIKPFTSIALTIIGCIIIVITLTAFFVMLLKRYITIIFLLILLPLSWMAWVFPYLSKHFSSWWESFIKNLLFPPVVLFFLWLGITTTQKYIEQRPSPEIVAMGNSLGDVIGTLAQGIFIPFINVVVLSGLMMGGLLAAEKLGVAGSEIGTKMANGTKDWALKKTQRGVGTLRGKIARTEPVKSFATTLQKIGTKPTFLSKAAKATGMGIVGEKLGRGLDHEARAGEQGYKEYTKRAGELNKDQVLNRIAQSKGTELASLLAKATKDGYAQEAVGKIPVAELKSRLNKEDWARYGDPKAEGSLTAAVGPQEMREAQETMRTETDPAKLAVATDKFQKEMEKFIQAMDKEGAGKYEWKNALKSKDPKDIAAFNAMIRKLAETKPDFIGSISAKLGSEEKDRMTTQAHAYYSDAIAGLESDKVGGIDPNTLQLRQKGSAEVAAIDKKISELNKRKEKMEGSMSDVALLIDKLTATPAATPAAAPPAAAPKP